MSNVERFSPEDAARSCLAQLGEHYLTPPDPFRLARYLQVDVFLERKDEDFDGVTSSVGRSTIIILNKCMPITRQRFTLAHELGHYILHSQPDTLWHRDKRTPITPVERAANRFAVEFLMPALLVQHIRLITSGDPVAIARALRLSPETVRIRLDELGLTTP